MNYITLLGAETVERAGHNMSHAAESFSQSVGHLGETLREHSRSIEDSVHRFEVATERLERLNDKTGE